MCAVFLTSARSFALTLLHDSFALKLLHLGRVG